MPTYLCGFKAPLWPHGSYSGEQYDPEDRPTLSDRLLQLFPFARIGHESGQLNGAATSEPHRFVGADEPAFELDNAGLKSLHGDLVCKGVQTAAQSGHGQLLLAQGSQLLQTWIPG
jgi:hypothetical protein